MTRQNDWNDIWNKKYNTCRDKELHISAGFDDLSYPQWKKLTQFFINKVGFSSSSSVLEVGCGSGAFLKELNVKSLSGIDQSSEAISKINTTLNGDFKISEASKIPFDDKYFDIVFSFSVFFYFNDFNYARETINEMCRVLKQNGKIFIGEISDIEKKEIANQLRDESHLQREKHRITKKNTDHLYFPKSFFKEIARSKNMNIEIIDQDIPELDFYNNASYRFSVILTKGE